MTTLDLDREKIRELFDLRRRAAAGPGRYSVYEDDPYPQFHELRERGPVVEGIPHELIGFDGFAFFHGVPDPSPHHFSIFSYAECDVVYRNEELFRSAPLDADFQGSSHRRQHALHERRAPPPLPGAGAAVVRAEQGEVVDGELDRPDRARADRQLRGRQASRAQHRLRRRHPDADDHQQLRAHHRGGAAGAGVGRGHVRRPARSRTSSCRSSGRGGRSPATTS